MNNGSSVRCASDGHTLNAPQATTHICVICATLTASRPYSSGSCRCRSDDICHTSVLFNFDFNLNFKFYCGNVETKRVCIIAHYIHNIRYIRYLVKQATNYWAYCVLAIINNQHMFVIEMIVIAISGKKNYVLFGQILCLKAELQYGIYYICNDTSLLLSLK